MARQESLDASDRAHTVIGLYGDPTVSWSILLQAELTGPLDAADVSRRLETTARAYPHLGSAPTAESIPPGGFDAVLDRFATAPYERGSPLVRVAVGTNEPVLLIAAHHGALDGLGLLALLGVALDAPVSSTANGIESRAAGRSFLGSAARRLAEALLAPPTRISPAQPPQRRWNRAGDVFAARTSAKMRISSARLTAAAADTTAAWNTGRGARSTRIVAAVGASRRSGANVRPDHDSAFFRLRLGSSSSTARAAELLTAQAPEPDFPARSSRIARLATRMLAGRLGSTFLVSNLGVVSAGDRVRALTLYPAASGRSGVAFGAVSVAETSTLTVRARRRDFDRASAAALLDQLVRSLRHREASDGRGQPGDPAHQ